MEKIVVNEWDAFTGGFDAWVAQMESDRINFELQLLADAEFDRIVEEQHNDMVDELIAEFDSSTPEWLR